jgi:hypothetical protein
MAGGISPNTCPSAPGANHPVASLVIKAKGSSRLGSHNPWPLLVGAEAAGPIWIGDSEGRVVHVPRGHVGDTPYQMRQGRRQTTRWKKGE